MSDYQPMKVHFGMPLAEKLGDSVRSVYPAFPLRAFLTSVAERVEPLELKGRVALIAQCLRGSLPDDYREALSILLLILGPELTDEEGMFNHGYHLMPVARFVEVFGIDHFNESMQAMREITKRHTAEYAIRPYLNRYPDRVLAMLRKWTRDKNQNVRRLVSEGTRTRLPWAQQLQIFVEDPRPVIELLDLLKDDSSRFVQKSVANNLNDIGKDHPELAVDVARGWQKASPTENTQWIIKHGLRGLTQRGHEGALSVMGYSGVKEIELIRLRISPPTLRIGEVLTFAFSLRNASKTSRAMNVDYAIHYARPNGRAAAKVFRIRELTLAAGETATIQKDHPFRLVRTRKYFSGRHAIEIQLNGRSVARSEFQLRD
jgi:3-methyladenine DNA glycosylase AlkC